MQIECSSAVCCPIYNNNHLACLNIISNLLERGYTLNSMKGMLHALEQGIGLEELIGIESAISSPWGSEEAEEISMLTLTKMFDESRWRQGTSQ